jgi:hypothetical protein
MDRAPPGAARSRWILVEPGYEIAVNSQQMVGVEEEETSRSRLGSRLAEVASSKNTLDDCPREFGRRDGLTEGSK